MPKPFRRRGNRIKPILNIFCQWYYNDSTYPERIHIVMSDGRIVRYNIEESAAMIHTGRDGWEKTGRQVVGYRYKERPLT